MQILKAKEVPRAFEATATTPRSCALAAGKWHTRITPQRKKKIAAKTDHMVSLLHTVSANRLSIVVIDLEEATSLNRIKERPCWFAIRVPHFFYVYCDFHSHNVQCCFFFSQTLTVGTFYVPEIWSFGFATDGK